jgi:hypothetical protein
MAIEIVDLPIQHGEFPKLCGCLPEGIPVQWKAPELDVVRCCDPANWLVSEKPGNLNHSTC